VVRLSQLFGSTSSSSRHRTKAKGTDGFAVRALDLALKDGACRALKWRVCQSNPFIADSCVAFKFGEIAFAETNLGSIVEDRSKTCRRHDIY
jgi:hypothetical protein